LSDVNPSWQKKAERKGNTENPEYKIPRIKFFHQNINLLIHKNSLNYLSSNCPFTSGHREPPEKPNIPPWMTKIPPWMTKIPPWMTKIPPWKKENPYLQPWSFFQAPETLFWFGKNRSGGKNYL